MYNLEALLDSIARSGCAYFKLKKYEEALKAFKAVFDVINAVFCGGEKPPLHCRECGDIHSLTAQVYIEMNDIENAFVWLEKMADYDLNIRGSAGKNPKTPLLCDTKDYRFYPSYNDIKFQLKEKLENSAFDSVRNYDRFRELLNLCE